MGTHIPQQTPRGLVHGKPMPGAGAAFFYRLLNAPPQDPGLPNGLPGPTSSHFKRHAAKATQASSGRVSREARGNARCTNPYPPTPHPQPLRLGDGKNRWSLDPMGQNGGFATDT